MGFLRNSKAQTKWTNGRSEKPAARRTTLSSETATEHDPALQRLAQFFPHGTPVRIPVQVVRCEVGCRDWARTVIEYGTSREVIFRCSLPLEFGERVRLANVDGSLDTEAEVLAVQIGEAQTLVAARFIGDVANWIIKA